MNISSDALEKEEIVVAATVIDDVFSPSYDGSVDQEASAKPSGQTIPLMAHTQITMNGIASSWSSQVAFAPSVASELPSLPRPATLTGPLALESLPSVSVIIPPPKFKPLPYSTARSGLAYDVRMRYHQQIPTEPGDKDYHPADTLPHPDNPRRISDIFNELADAGLVEDEKYPEFYSDFQLVRIPVRQATCAELCLVHSKEHVDFVQNLSEKSNYYLRTLGNNMESVYYHNMSWLSASLSAGGAIEATRAVVAGQLRNAFALIRPPGHHAEPPGPHIDQRECGGFCFFNNVPIAVKVAQAEFPSACRKILILDWDVHHGNGIQRTFYEDPNVLYISLHVYYEDDGKSLFYPCKTYGNHLQCGSGFGKGKNVNVPWICPGMGDADYMLAFQQIVMPIAIEFDPDLVMISAGFDAAEGDELGKCHVTPAGFAHMTHMLMQLAKSKVVACLEGGYNSRSLAKSALAMVRTLMGEPPERMGDLTPTAAGVSTVLQVVRTQAQFWRCLYPKVENVPSKDFGSERLHDIIREWQGKKLWEDYNMSPMLVLRQGISHSFREQVLATSNYSEERPLLIIFHDPPEALGYSDPRTNQLEIHNTWITDVSKTYVDWAVRHDFAVIDVNIPKPITDIEDGDHNSENDIESDHGNTTKELANYLWENYVEVNNLSHIFLLGIGDAYSGLINLLSEHRSCAREVTLTISFIAQNPLRVMLKPKDDEISHLYYQRSMIFVADNHPAFEPDKGRKLKRKHGKITRSPYTRLQEMLFMHKKEVTDKLLELTEKWRMKQLAKRTPEKDANGDINLAESREADLEDVSDFATQANPYNFSLDGADTDALPDMAIEPHTGSLPPAPAEGPTTPLRWSSRSLERDWTSPAKT